MDLIPGVLLFPKGTSLSWLWVYWKDSAFALVYNFGATFELGGSSQFTEMLPRYSLREFVYAESFPQGWGMPRMLSKYAEAFPIRPRPEIGRKEVV